jgi:uncharacterized protein YecA (UPF0149 family)
MTNRAPKQQDQGSPGSQGGQQQQQQSGEGQQYGEGNYKATRDYNRGLKDHVEHHDIEKDAREAAPKNDQEAREMEEAEREGLSRAKGNSAKAEDDPNVN